jgi:hypothetical protein
MDLMARDSGRRLIARDACSWCGHAPHDSACGVSIRVALNPDRFAACPCSHAAP